MLCAVCVCAAASPQRRGDRPRCRQQNLPSWLLGFPVSSFSSCPGQSRSVKGKDCGALAPCPGNSCESAQPSPPLHLVLFSLDAHASVMPTWNLSVSPYLSSSPSSHRSRSSGFTLGGLLPLPPPSSFVNCQTFIGLSPDLAPH